MRRKASGRPAPDGRAGARRESRPDLRSALPLLLIPAALGAWIHRGAAGAFFSPDDLLYLERAHGFLPFPAVPWRLLSGRLYYLAAFPLFGAQPAGYHAVNLALHALNTWLVGIWALRRGASRPAAFLAAALFGTTSLAMTAIWQVVGVGELAAAGLTLIALLLFASSATLPRRLGIAAHAGALLCKESVGLAPLTALLPSGTGRPGRAPWGPVATALVLSLAMWAFALSAPVRSVSLQGEAYAMGWGPHLVSNLLTYAFWSADLFGPAPAGAAVPWPAGAVGVAVLCCLALYAWRSSSGAARGGLALWILALAPVLPLKHHVYEHYLYLPFAGWAIAASCLVTDAILWIGGRLKGRGGAARPRPERLVAGATWIAVLAVVLLHGLAAERAIASRSTLRVAGSSLLADPMLRKMQIAANVRHDLAAALGPGADRVLILTPPASVRFFSVEANRQVDEAAAQGAPRYDLLAAVLDDGRALRALLPRLRYARLGQHLTSADTNCVLATHYPDGRLLVFGRGPAAHVALAEVWAQSGYLQDARVHLEEARSLYPGAPELAEAARRLAGAPAAEDRR